MLEVKGITVKFGGLTAVKSMNMTVEKGRFTRLLVQTERVKLLFSMSLPVL
jgi:ABC-type branched-subunit amino acid transport system ATPase component